MPYRIEGKVVHGAGEIAMRVLDKAIQASRDISDFVEMLDGDKIVIEFFNDGKKFLKATYDGRDCFLSIIQPIDNDYGISTKSKEIVLFRCPLRYFRMEFEKFLVDKVMDTIRNTFFMNTDHPIDGNVDELLKKGINRSSFPFMKELPYVRELMFEVEYLP